ncbi:MAG TPA: tol-pal system protein YbgF [Kofleriaceae bacterium]|nr:tol-pal system protein YbgF [Kofleriaceae bacterium]
MRSETRADKATIRDLQNQVFVLKDQLETAQVAAGRAPGQVPKLPVEVLAPQTEKDPPAGDSDLSELGDGARVVGVADDGTEIVYVGDAAAGKAAPPADPDPDASDPAPRPRANHAPPRELAPIPSTTASDQLGTTREVPKVSAVAAHRPPPAPRGDHAETHDPRAEYQSAVDALKQGDHAAAIAGLREFVRRYPDHDYADNAQYWLGEAYYDQKDYKRAAEEFRKTVERYPRGNKAPDALLKLGYSYAALGQIEQARATLEQVVAVYPRTGPAQLAAQRLDTLGK